MKSFQRLPFVIVMWLLALHAVNAAGVAVTKEQKFHADSCAKPFVFDTVKDYREFVIFETGTRAISIERATFVEYVEVPAHLPKELVKDEQVIPFRESLKKIRAFTSRFPLSEPLLRANLVALQSLIDNYDGGRVLLEKKWIARTEYQEQQKQRAEVAAQIERQRQAQIAQQQQAKREEAERVRIEQLAQMETVKPLAEKQMGEASIENAQFRVYWKSGSKLLVEILTPPVEDPQLVVLVEDAENRPLKENVTYAGNLFYSGNYPAEGNADGIRAYCIDRSAAVSKLSYRLSLPQAVKVIAPSRSWVPKPKNKPSYSSGDMVWVDGYFKDDGTWVSGHYRNAPSQPAPLYSPPSYSSYSSSPSTGSSGTVHVNGYFRKNGTYVHSYTRRK